MLLCAECHGKRCDDRVLCLNYQLLYPDIHIDKCEECKELKEVIDCRGYSFFPELRQIKEGQSNKIN